MNSLPAGWSVVPFKQIADYTIGRTPARASATYWNGVGEQFPWVAISDMESYGTIETTAETISEIAFHEIFRERIVPAGTLLMSFKLTVGRVATLGVAACHNEAIISIYPRDGVDQRYLGYYLSQIDYSAQQDRQVKGNTLNKSKIDRLPVLLPPDNEQPLIADVLDFCRTGINTERAAEATATELKQTTMHELFTCGLRGEPQKQTEIGLVPESWNLERLDSRALVVSTRMSYKELEDRENAQGAVVRAVGIKVSDMNRIGNETSIQAAALEKLLHTDVAAYRCAPPGTIVFPKRGAAIATNKKRLTETWSAFDPNVIGVVPNSTINARFLFHWFQLFDLRTITEPGPTPQLNKKHLEPLRIPVPPTTREQEEIAAILDAIDRKIDLHRKKRAVLEELFQSLLHKLMTGEVRVEELNLTALASTKSGGAT